MKCTKCGKDDTRVLESREAGEGDTIRRRRQCQNDSCSNRFTTYERVERPSLTIVKKDGVRQSYDRDKLLVGLRLCTEKTTVSAQEVDAIASRVEDALYSLNKEEVPSTKVGEFIMDELAKTDQVAYVRFASVYRSFKDLAQFEQELKIIRNKEV